MMSSTDAYIDVVELCALLQCLGFSVKSLDTSDGNMSHDGGLRTVVINCQSSGLHVVLENPSLSCSCPTSGQQQNSGIWQVSGVTGGKQLDKEFGCSLLGSLPKSHRDRLTKELHDIIRCIKQHNETDAEIPKDAIANKSASMIELKTPDKLEFKIKPDTPTRYRSLDTLTAPNKRNEQPLPTPGVLQRSNLIASSENMKNSKGQMMCSRQSTYTLSSTPGSTRRRNKTSSPIKASSQSSILDSLVAAEKAAEDLRCKLSLVIREFMDDEKNDSSISSLALDVSKISVLKVAESSKAQFASSPNLSGITHVKEELTKSRLKRFESASTSNLAPIKFVAKESSLSKLRRLSPNFFKNKKETPNSKIEKVKPQNSSSKLNTLIKPKIVTPVRTLRVNTEASPNLSSSSKKKFSHVKSTIPRPLKKE